MIGRRFELSEASNGGWIVTEPRAVDPDGRIYVSTIAAFTDTADMISGLAERLQRDLIDTVAMQQGDV